MLCWAVVSAVRGAEPSVERSRSGPPCCVDGWAHPAEPRMGPFVVVVSAPGFQNGARM